MQFRGQDSMLPPQGAWVGSLVRAVISHMTVWQKNPQKNLLPSPTSSLAAGHYILLVAFLLLLLLLSLLKCFSNALLPRQSFGHHVLMTFLSNHLLEGALRCL